MITIVFGAPGVGKSALMTRFIKQLYMEQGRAILSSCQNHIAKINAERGSALTVPDKVPIFSDFKTRFKVGYQKWYETYFINGFYLGMSNDTLNVMTVPPGSKIFLSEAQRYYNSRQSRTMPDFVSRMYEMHRHYWLDIYMDTQRPILIDANIRELCKHFIEVQKLEHETDFAGRILSSKFYCREFLCWSDTEIYLESGAETYTPTVYENRGNIFNCFDSFNYFDEFVPPEGKDFDYLPYLSKSERGNNQFYKLSEPKEYRGSKNGKN